ncbi:trigger factor [Kitasatospora sp. NPDC093102]|uniref:trigger factor n=1 Tax=Kitasatospora sp. NPDC093102 TaxID=3155069 RepID=UPI0034170DE9
MQSTVETLDQTRVRVLVEVPPAEFAPHVDMAYATLGDRGDVPGYPEGGAPASAVEAHAGRRAVLAEAVEDAQWHWFERAAKEHGLRPVGFPQFVVLAFQDGGELRFTAEVDVRPTVELPEYRGLSVTVAPAGVRAEEVEAALSEFRLRFATGHRVDRPAGPEDIVVVDLEAVIDGQVPEDCVERGLGYVIGSGALVPGIDEAVVGLSAGERTTFRGVLGGERTGEAAEVGVTVLEVQEKRYPELDDAFARFSRGLDTLAELREECRAELAEVKRIDQQAEAEQLVLEDLVGRAVIPLPERVVEEEVAARRHRLESHELPERGMDFGTYLGRLGIGEEEFEREIRAQVEFGFKAELVLDAVASAEHLAPDQDLFSDYLNRGAERDGLQADQYVQELLRTDQLSPVLDEALRGTALLFLLRNAHVVDTTGAAVALPALGGNVEAEAEAEAGVEAQARAQAQVEADAVAPGAEAAAGIPLFAPPDIRSVVTESTAASG